MTYDERVKGIGRSAILLGILTGGTMWWWGYNPFLWTILGIIGWIFCLVGINLHELQVLNEKDSSDGIGQSE